MIFFEKGLGIRGNNLLAGSCCPIPANNKIYRAFRPEGTFHQGEEVSEISLPIAQKGHDSHQQIGEQRAPYLPFYGVTAKTNEGRDLQSLLNFLKKGLNSPTAAIQIADTGSGPLHIIAQEAYGYFHTVTIQHLSYNVPETLRVTGVTNLSR